MSGWKWISDEIRRSRRPRQCLLCGQGIDVRDVYIARTGTTSGEIETVSLHRVCESITVRQQWVDVDWIGNEPADFFYAHRAELETKQEIKT